MTPTNIALLVAGLLFAIVFLQPRLLRAQLWQATFTPLASQLSAAVADTSGAGGLISESTGKRVSVNHGHLVTAVADIAITWLADIYQIITYASQAFVTYYALQSLQAALSAWRLGKKTRAALYAVGIVIAVVVVLFAVPAEG